MTGSTHRNKNAVKADKETFSFTVHSDTVTIQNESKQNPAEHEYIVSHENGGATDCTCPHRQYRGERCKHMIAVEHEAVLPDTFSTGNGRSEAASLSEQDKQDVRSALATEIAEAVEAGNHSEAERLSDLRKRL